MLTVRSNNVWLPGGEHAGRGAGAIIFDTDCCTDCGEGSCAPGYTYAGQFLMDSEVLSSTYPDFYPSCLGFYYESYPAKLCGNTCCVPSNGTARAMAGG